VGPRAAAGGPLVVCASASAPLLERAFSYHLASGGPDAYTKLFFFRIRIRYLLEIALGQFHCG